MARLCTNIENSEDVSRFDEHSSSSPGQTHYHSNMPINLNLYNPEEYVKERLESDEEQIEFIDKNQSNKFVSILAPSDVERTKRVNVNDSDQNENNHVNSITECKSFYQYVQSVSKLPSHQLQSSKESVNGDMCNVDGINLDILGLSVNSVDNHEPEFESDFENSKVLSPEKEEFDSDCCDLYSAVSKSSDVRSKRVKKPSLKFLESVGSDPDPNELKKMCRLMTS